MPPKRTLSPAEGPRRKKKSLATGAKSTNEDEIESMERTHLFSLHTLTEVPKLQNELLIWFDTVRHVRGMPWRKPFCWDYDEQTQRAYEVWVSEVMLQQTRVATVIPYYNRWMEKFPTIYDLAKADIDAVNKLWKGLGYYSRASRLLAGAKKAVHKFSGRLPDDVKMLEKEIPGIGRYSAGAICSIAFGRHVPVLDGNVHRLLSRLLAVYSSPKAKKTLDLLWKTAEEMVSTCNNPGDVNQALIELGSTVCKVRDPACESCPLKSRCGAFAERTIGPPAVRADVDIEDLCQICEPIPPGNMVTRFPMRSAKTKSRFETDLVNLIEWRGNGERQFVLVCRPNQGLLAGLYEFPSCEIISANETDLLERSYHVLDSLFEASLSKSRTSELHVHQQSSRPLGQNRNSTRVMHMQCIGDYVHVFSHIKKTYYIVSVVLAGGPSPPAFRKVSEDEATVNGDIGRRAKWSCEKDVVEANISTGVMNIWKKIRSYWDTASKEDDSQLELNYI